MSRKIYFAGSIRAGRDDAELYARIVGLLQKYGRVLTEHVGDPNLKESGTGTYASMDDIISGGLSWSMKARHSLHTEREGVKCKEWHQKLDQ